MLFRKNHRKAQKYGLLMLLPLLQGLGGLSFMELSFASDTLHEAPDMAGRYYMAGNPAQWFFVSGPEHSDNQIMTLQSPFPAGRIIFSCHSDGHEEMALSLAGVKHESGWKGVAHVTIGPESHDAKIESRGIVPKQLKTAFNFPDENEVAGILSGMARYSSTRVSLAREAPQIASRDGIFMTIGIEGVESRIPIPPLGLAEAASGSCKRWYNDRFLSAHGFETPDQKHAPSDSTPHTPLHHVE